MEQGARDEARRKLDRIDADVESAADTIRRYDHTMNTPKYVSNQDALLAEMKEQRAWNRYRPLLDAGKDPLQVIGSAAEDPVALRTLQQELPYYLEAKDPFTSGDYLATIRAELDSAYEPYLDRWQREARAMVRGLETGLYRLQVGGQFVNEEVKGSSNAVNMPTWSDQPGDPEVVEV